MHVGMILDGNGRWALERGRARSVGHRAGARAVRRVVESAAGKGISVLTLFAFSADNWRRPVTEVEALMALFARYLSTEADRFAGKGVRLNVIGRRDRLAPPLVSAIERAETKTSAGSEMLLRVAVDYSARWTLASAARTLAGHAPRCDTHVEDRFGRELERACHSVAGVPAVDLLVRTSGEQRLSDFLLWESAYAELLFVPTLWPDFDGADLDAALAELGRRQRRFGGLATVDGEGGLGRSENRVGRRAGDATGDPRPLAIG